MYNVKGTSKFVAKTTRRGIPQNIENLREPNKKVTENEDNDYKNGPKPVFHKKSSPSSPKHNQITPQHEEIINFIHESWNSVCAEFEESAERNEGEPSVCYYEDGPCISLQDFRPFDLESWWGKRLFAYVTNPETQKN
ncbi:MAPK regulated corepressor interacting protein 2 [Diorhabda carinulata]|uniref:MAPK regulated corepressor interacting protein 2 n=1 Tax=Diorhabda sublineata TaxID=1163346 RepID=UPI0024E189A0|nr:MAPK regulated corepressor interacting protein 2 [Diorhabda sublineata]XP_057664621.1 MAPK regulated corepressor interacting protein 2 [Diorhabda carinulata]XP_057664622.1 MAPK regulated corepressor interacting protein 2 [Diorhabda carinulata]